jgi:Cu(I)/Ag(I) efflux system membrane fusion protein
MKPRSIFVVLIIAGVFAAGGYALYTLGMNQGMQMASSPATGASRSSTETMKAGDTDPATGKKILYWHDPMVPGKRFDKPGKSPFMDMMLVPVYAESDTDQGQVAISPRVQQSLGMRTAEVTRGRIAQRVEAVGTIAFNERDQAVVQARAAGFVERLHVRATLDRVAKGTPLVELYVPDWVAAQEEFLSIRRMQGTELASLVDGARQRMRQAGMTDEQIRAVEQSGKVQPRTTLVAPIGGVVVELLARDGMTVTPGAMLFRINGLATVWANAEVPESQASLLRVGAPVEARSPATPGSVFKGKVQAILPEINPSTRTVKARIELVNTGGALSPGMFVSIALSAPADEGLMVPTDAVIRTGTRNLVMVAQGDGKFRPVEVKVGGEANGQTQITSGLAAGQRVVVSGQFLLDSEASLKSAVTRMEAPASTTPAMPIEHTGEARIESVRGDSVTLSHGPIPTLKWGAMTMDFAVPPGGVPPSLKPGQTVTFAFRMNKEGTPVLTRIEPSKGAPLPAAVEKKS